MNEMQAIRKNHNQRLREQIQRNSNEIRKSQNRIAELRKDRIAELRKEIRENFFKVREE